MQVGEVVMGRFVLDAVAGSGGMGTVYRARDLAGGGPVALKVMRASESQRFAREASVLSELSHPSIVKYVAHGKTPTGDDWLAMEWLEGEDLASRLRRGALSVEDSVSVAAQAASALAVAHERGVVHRDVKPANLFLVDGDVARVRVLDFGIARLANATEALTRTGVVVGTPGYLAPEQARGGKIDARADVFALGCVLFECLTGRVAFSGANVIALLAKILFEEPPRVRDVASHVPAVVDALVARMLAKEQTRRRARARRAFGGSAHRRRSTRGVAPQKRRARRRIRR